MKKKLGIFLIILIVSLIVISSIYKLDNETAQTSSVLDSTTTIEEIPSSGEIEENYDPTSSGDAEPVDITAINNSNNDVDYSNSNANKLTSKSPYYIKINNAQNVVTIYSKDSNGDYTKAVKAMVCSTGSATPKAGSSYKITTYKNRWNGLQGNVYGQYATQIIGNILFHSVPYTAKNNSSLEYWEYDKLGTAASLGCVRLTVEDAKWIYDNIEAGTIVEFYDDANNPGPLGKPTAQKISDNLEFRNWDPTDPDIKNPWNGGSGNEVKEEKPSNNNTEITVPSKPIPAQTEPVEEIIEVSEVSGDEEASNNLEENTDDTNDTTNGNEETPEVEIEQDTQIETTEPSREMPEWLRVE